jgi:protoheme IX farnesyltransferase
MGFFMGTTEFNFSKFILVCIGGFLITGASNALNQLFEKDTDKLMKRTENRPLPASRIEPVEAMGVAVILAALGMILLLQLNVLTAVLGFLSLALYAFVYTPLKKITPFSVFVGAIPGALPPLIGYVAATGSVDFIAVLLFCIQFIWQFPHFWSIAWVLDDDYRRAGFKLLPSAGGCDRQSAFNVMIYTAGLLPMALIPWFFNVTGNISAIIITLITILFILQTFKLLKHLNNKSAASVMFGSFIYLPIIMICLVLDKI